MEQVKQYLELAPMWLQLVVYAVSCLMVLGTVYISLTPGKDDDNWLAGLLDKPIIGKILQFVIAFSPIVKKVDGVGLSNKKETGLIDKQ